MAAEEQPWVALEPKNDLLEPNEATDTVSKFNRLLLDSESRISIQTILTHPNRVNLLQEELDEKNFRDGEVIQPEIVAFRALRGLLFNKSNKFTGWQLNFDPTTWDVMPEDSATYKAFFDNTDPNKRGKMKIDEEINLACEKIGSYVKRFVEYHPIKVNDGKPKLSETTIVALPLARTKKSKTAVSA